MPLGRWSISVNINTLKSIYYAHFYSSIKYGIIFGGISSNSAKIFTLQKKIVRIMAGAQPRTSCNSSSLLKQLQILFSANIYFHLGTSLSIITKFFKQIHLYTMLIQGISITFIDQIPTYLVFKSTFYAGTKIFNSVPPSVTIRKNDKAKFKTVLRKYIHTYSFYSVDEFFMCKDDI